MRPRALAATLVLGLVTGCGAPVEGAPRTAALADMVALLERGYGIRDPAVLRAMRAVDRSQFVPAEWVDRAFDDHPLPIGHGQTISQPYIVAFMTECLALRAGDSVLEIGTGSGYQAAVLARIVARVSTIEIVEPLGREAGARLRALGYDNVEVRIGDGYRGWPERAPFDAIMVTAAPDHVPQPLLDQLKVGGRMVLPVGAQLQELVLVRKTAAGTVEQSLIPVRFVPMTGEAAKR